LGKSALLLLRDHDHTGKKRKYWLVLKKAMRAAPRFFGCALAVTWVIGSWHVAWRLQLANHLELETTTSNKQHFRSALGSFRVPSRGRGVGVGGALVVQLRAQSSAFTTTTCERESGIGDQGAKAKAKGERRKWVNGVAWFRSLAPFFQPVSA
jgi:hypothetical protein